VCKTIAGKDRSVPEQSSQFDAALDLFVFAPLGMVMTAAEELPKLAAKGRAQVDGQLTAARMVGQFAVAQGRKRVERRWGQAGRPTSANGARSGGEPPDSGRRPVQDLTYDEMLGTVPDEGDVGPAFESTPPSSPLPSANGLAIPGYDSLSASQVVQRLAGLSSEELAAVGEYESAHRGRRTVLTRVGQLQGS
jgi:hypothetical protein